MPSFCAFVSIVHNYIFPAYTIILFDVDLKNKIKLFLSRLCMKLNVDMCL